MAVDYSHPPSEASPFKILGVAMLDIVPTTIQWQAFASPRASVAYYHWPFLATPNAAKVIAAYGGDKWTRDAFTRLQSKDPKVQAIANANDALQVYESQFSRQETIEGSCADYAAASDQEPKDQDQDQAAGRKIDMPALVFWSTAGLGSVHGDVGGIWKDWMKDPSKLHPVPCEGGVGHYLPEECPDLISSSLSTFVSKL